MFYDIKVSPPKLYYNNLPGAQATGVFCIFTMPKMMFCLKKALDKFVACLLKWL